MKVQIEAHMEGVLITPRRRRIRRAVMDHLKSFKVHSAYGNVFVQSFSQAKDLLSQLGISDDQISDVFDGWPIYADIDTWSFLHLVGWDAHEAIEVTEDDVMLNGNVV